MTRAHPTTTERRWAAVLRALELQAAIVRGSRAATEELASAIAERIGVDPARDAYPGLVANAGLTTQLFVLDFWTRSEPGIPLVPLLRDAFRQLGAGLRLPAPSGAHSPTEGTTNHV
jgi:hypothetical protein